MEFKTNLDPGRDGEEKTVVFAGSYEDIPENRSVKIPEGIVEISENAFREFENLEEVSLPKSLRIIGPAAFSGCKNLRKVVFSFGLEELLDEAFAFCPALTEVILPDSVKRIGEASEGILQSPRGESATEPTFGPSGSALRLNCCV